MMEFDCELEKKSRFYIRYSDDFLILCKNAEQASDLRGYLCEMLQMLGLELHEEKSCFGIIKNGFDFLGYHFNEKGKQVPIKAEQHLQNSLEQLWLEMKSHPIEQKLEKGLELSRGWQQYYRGERRAAGILELTVTIYGMQKGGIEDYTEIKEQRKTVHNLYEEVTFYLSDLWNNRHMNDMRLYEYEDYFEWREKTELKEISQKEIIPELFACYAKLLAEENTDDYMELMQIYSDIGNYETARQITEKIEKIKSAESRVPKQRLGKGISVEQKMEQAIIVKDINRFMNCFVGREDIYSEELEVNGRRRFEMVSQPLSIQEVRAHLAGERTLATYVQRNNGTAHFLVFDVDISKKILLQHGIESEQFAGYHQKAAAVTKRIILSLQKMGMHGYIEESGYRGYHVWIFFEEWIAVRYINFFSDCILQIIQPEEDILIDVIPNKTHLRPGKPGQAIKLPYGFHSKTGRRSKLLGTDFLEALDIEEYLHNIVSHSLNELKRNINKASRLRIPDSKMQTIEIPEEQMKQYDSSVVAVLQNCNLMKYLYCKAHTTGYLTHGERLSVLYVFGHLGDEGQKFVHTIMEFTVNYQFHVTQRFIDRLPEKPISCTKLREQYKQITAEYGCSCIFRRSKNCYPSPVLHAIKQSREGEGNITIPSSKPMTKEREQKVREEINVAVTVQKKVKRILELKKQRRGLDKSIGKMEFELTEIFDAAGIDCMEIELGMLCRRSTESGKEWYIEI